MRSFPKKFSNHYHNIFEIVAIETIRDCIFINYFSDQIQLGTRRKMLAAQMEKLLEHSLENSNEHVQQKYIG